MTTHTITAMFDSRAEAERATEALVSNAGVARSSIRIDADAGTNAGTEGAAGGKGLMASLADLFLPDTDRHSYAEGMRRGGVLLSVRAEEGQMERVSSTLEAAGAVDLDTREAEWRQSGWTGQATAAPTTATAATTTATPPAATGREEAIPIAEERISVGKRVASTGRVRVHSYVVETPVEEQVRLREEHVHVEGRTVDRPATGNEADLFRERVIEAEERSEEAVVQKDVRVTGEVVVNKDATERTETVRDTVRRTEVDVDETNAANTNTTDTRRTGKAG
jgi:stress response protein YsnF